MKKQRNRLLLFQDRERNYGRRDFDLPGVLLLPDSLLREYQILKSIPGIGPVYAAGILAEIGSVRCFNNNNALAKYSGIIWRDNQSGEFDSEDTPMMKAGNRYLRYYLIQAAGSVVRYCPEYEDYYNKKFAEVPKHQHKRALALTARKLIRLIFGLLDKNQLYSPAKSR